MSSILVETHSRTPPLEVKITIQFWLYYYIEYAFPISITKKISCLHLTGRKITTIDKQLVILPLSYMVHASIKSALILYISNETYLKHYNTRIKLSAKTNFNASEQLSSHCDG